MRVRRIEQEVRQSREPRGGSARVRRPPRGTLRESREHHEALLEDQRRFMRDCLLRLDRIFERHARTIDDMRDQIRTNSEATWRMLDRFDRLDPGGAAGGAA